MDSFYCIVSPYCDQLSHMKTQLGQVKADISLYVSRPIARYNHKDGYDQSLISATYSAHCGFQWSEGQKTEQGWNKGFISVFWRKHILATHKQTTAGMPKSHNPFYFIKTKAIKL